MRFLWLALSIFAPLVLVEVTEGMSHESVKFTTYIAVGCLAEVILIGLSVAEFVRYHKQQEYLAHQKIKQDRDEDIKKWRKEFMNDSLDLYEMQKESLKQAKNFTQHE